MAPLTTTVNAQDAARIANNQLASPLNQQGAKIATVTYTNNTGSALAADSIIDFGPVLTRGKVVKVDYITDALGAGRTFDLGYQEHVSELDGTTEAAVIDAFLDGVDVSGATNASQIPADASSAGAYVELQGKANLLGKIIGDTLADGDSVAFNLHIQRHG